MLVLLVALLAFASAGFAQITGTLTGTVVDPSQAVVAGAKVTLQNTATNDIRTTTTNEVGHFAFAAVQPSTYILTAELAGFKKVQRTGLVMNPNDKRDVSDLVLEVATTGEQVTVVATPDTLVPLDSGEKSAVLTSKDISNLSVLGRNVGELIKIIPGMAMAGNGARNKSGFDTSQVNIYASPMGNYAANGLDTQAINMQSDGANLVDPGNNGAAVQNVNTDMVQEVKVSTSNFSAESAKGPVVFSAVGKSGTAAFHGESYLYARHSALNANDYFTGTNSHLPKPEARYLFPGGQIGGPVLVPGTKFNKNRDKLFFFGAFEYYDQVLPGEIKRGYTPTDAMRKGDFSQTALTAAYGAVRPSGIQAVPANIPGVGVIANGQIPQNLWDAGGVAMLKALPQPNADPAQNNGYNFVKQFTSTGTTWQMRVRGDYSISDNTKLALSYNKQNASYEKSTGIYWAPDWALPYPSPVLEQANSQSWSGNLTHVFNASLTNEVVVTFTNYKDPYNLADPDKVSKEALGYPYQGIFKNSARQIPNIQGGWADGSPYFSMPGLTGSGNSINYAHKRMPTFADNLMWVKNNHTVKFGFYMDSTGNEQSIWATSQGTITVDIGGNSMTSGNTVADLLLGRTKQFSQDLKQPIGDLAYKTIAGYVNDSWKVNRRLTLDLGLRFDHITPWSDLGNLGLAVWQPEKYSNDPARMGDLTGMNWYAIDKSVPKSGAPARWAFVSPRFGMAWDIFGTGKTVLRGGWGRFHFNDSYNAVTDASQIPQGNRTWTSPVAAMLSSFDQTSAGDSGPTKTSITVMDPRDNTLPETDSYSFSIAQRLPLKSLFELSYVGNTTRNLLKTNAFQNINLVPFGGLFASGDPTNANYDDYRPFKNYQDISLITHGLYSNYNSLQATWNKQTGRYTFMLNYTFGKAMGIANSADPFNIDNNYGVTTNDRTHIFNAAYNVDLPSPVRNNAVLKGIVNGWQISGITQLQSGAVLQGAHQSFSLQGTDANGVSLSNRTWLGTDRTSKTSINVQPVLLCDPRSNLAPGQYINGTCFGIPPAGHQGASVFPAARGPAFFNSDVSVFKNFNISESKKLRFQFSGYNFLNHPLSSFDSNAVGNLTLNFQNGKLVNNNFGIPNVKYGNRVIQMAVKFSF